MGRLPTEFSRLYLVADPAFTAGAAPSIDLIDAPRPVRALVLEVARPADWAPLAAVWQGVQGALGLPAPAIAVNGADGLQLWFSLATAVDPAIGLDFLEGLRQRFLAELPLARVALRSAPALAGEPEARGTWTPVPHERDGRWSAFVAPDLAPIFSDTPWLEMPPPDEGQATLLAKLRSIPTADFDAALATLRPQRVAARDTPSPVAAHPTSDTEASQTLAGQTSASVHLEAQQFLRSVMHDPLAPLALRVEAAKALLAR